MDFEAPVIVRYCFFVSFHSYDEYVNPLNPPIQFQCMHLDVLFHAEVLSQRKITRHDAHIQIK